MRISADNPYPVAPLVLRIQPMNRGGRRAPWKPQSRQTNLGTFVTFQHLFSGMSFATLLWGILSAMLMKVGHRLSVELPSHLPLNTLVPSPLPTTCTISLRTRSLTCQMLRQTLDDPLSRMGRRWPRSCCSYFLEATFV